MFSLDDLLIATEGKLLSKGKEAFNQASIDTRTIGENDLFFPLKGLKTDGHEFLSEALSKASGAVVSKKEKTDFKNKTVVFVENTLSALQRLARHLRKKFKGKVIAVVGSNGKTTTKELIADFLSAKYKVLKTEGNLNNNIGVPLCISRLDSDAQIMVLELGTNRYGDIRELCEIVYPDYALITNIGYEHIEGFGSLEGVRDGELEILPFVNTVFANGDDIFLMEGLKNWNGNLLTFGVGRNCNFRAENIVLENEYVEFNMISGSLEFNLRANLTGIYNVYNITGAVSVALSLGISSTDIQHRLKLFHPVRMRGEIIKINGLEILFDAYNANPSSMRAALEELSRRKKQRQAVAVLGDMLELGQLSERAHEELGILIKKFGIDVFVGVGKMVKNALKYIDGQIFETPSEAGEFLKKKLKGSEVILIKGSRAMKMEDVLEVLRR